MKKSLRVFLPVLLVISMLFTLGADGMDMAKLDEESEVEVEELREESDSDLQMDENAEIDRVEKPQEESGEKKAEDSKVNNGEKAREERKETKEATKKIEKEAKEEEAEEIKSNLAEDIRPTRHLKFPVPMMHRNSAMSNGSSEGFVGVGKTAERYKEAVEKCRTYRVQLDITGKPPEIPVDVVLILDKSGSMNEKTPITSAPKPGSDRKYFVRVGSSFSDYVKVEHSSGNTWRYYQSGWGGGWRYVTWDVNGNDTSAGSILARNAVAKPFYYEETRMDHAKQASINFAGKVLNDGASGSRVSVVEFSGPSTISGEGSQNQAQTTVALTTDITTITNAINSITAVGGTNTEAGFIQGRNVISESGNPNSKKVVIMFTDGLPTASNGKRYAETTDITHDHIKSAISEGRSIFGGDPKIADLFTVGLLQGMNTEERNLAINILEQTQNMGFYEAPTAEDLDKIFDSIATQINYFAKDAVVVDKIGDNFDLLPETLPQGASYNPSTREITWNLGQISSAKSLSYLVKARAEFEGGEKAHTNEYAVLSYTDPFDNEGLTKTFPKPNVYVAKHLKVSLTGATIISGESIALGTGEDSAGENYMSKITGGDGDGTFTYEWKVKGEDRVISTDKNPNVSPEEDTEYELTVTDSNGCKAQASMLVVVRKKFNFKIKKKAKGSGELLDGAEFQLIKDNEVIKTVETTEGYADIKDVFAESYILKEVKAPSGYRLGRQEYGIEISEDGEITTDPNLHIEKEDNEQVIVIENTRKPALPDTGGFGSIIFTMLGLAIMALSYILYRKKYI